MPCYTVRLVTVEFKAKNIDILIAALKSLDWSFQQNGNKLSIQAGQMEIDLDKQQVKVRESSQSNINILKRKYSEMAIVQVAIKRKWALKQLKENKLRLRRY